MIFAPILGNIKISSESKGATLFSCKSLDSAEMDSCMILQLRTRIDSNNQWSYSSSFCLSYIRICIDGCICHSRHESSGHVCSDVYLYIKIPPQIAFGEFPALRNT
jgi:hypothetical protein